MQFGNARLRYDIEALVHTHRQQIWSSVPVLCNYLPYFTREDCLQNSQFLPLGAPIDPTFYLSRTVSNVICSVVFGKRFDYEDQRFRSLMKMINESFVEMSMPWAQVLTSQEATPCPPFILKASTFPNST